MSDATPAARKSLVFFNTSKLDEVPDEMKVKSPATMDVTFRKEEDKEPLMAGSKMYARHMKSFSSDFDESGLHMNVVEFEPNLITPLHSHWENCVYYVERGSIILGNRTLGPGEGFLTHANQPYGFVVGQEGLRLIEFSSGPHRNLAFEERNPGAWLQRLKKVVEKLES